MGIVAAREIALHMVSRNQFVLYCGSVEMRIVSPHAHQFCIMIHRICGIGDGDHFASQKEGIDQLSFGGHHLHSPDFIQQIWYGHQFPLLEDRKSTRLNSVTWPYRMPSSA